MSDTPSLPDNLPQCQEELAVAHRRLEELQLENAKLTQANEHFQQTNEQVQQVSAASTQRADELERVLDGTAAAYEQLQQEHAATLEELEWYKRWAFGRRRERVTECEGQSHLFDLDLATQEETAAAADDSSADSGVEVKGHRRRAKKREIDWDSLPQVVHHHEVPEAEKQCSCGRQKDHIGDDVTRELEFHPATLEAHVHVRAKFACRCCQDGVTTAPMPPRVIVGGIAGPGLIAQVIVSKFGDHLPLYRLEDIFTRHGVFIPRSTQCDWVKTTAGLLEPLYKLQCDLVLQSPLMWTDDTSVTVLGGPKGSFPGYFWTYLGDDQHPYSVYDFTKSRTRDGPATFLRNYSGYLHADAFTGYDAIFLGPGGLVREVACWSHARRKFFEARTNYPREAYQILEWIRQLYDLEDQALDWSAAARGELRECQANPILDKIEAYLAELSAKVLPKSSLGKAVTYARNQWAALRRYTEDGRLSIDNNVSERTLRHQAIGRKNWMFLGSEDAGPRAAVLYTILAGAKRHHIEPWTYVRELLLRVHAGDPRLEEMLPDRWAAAHPESVLNHRVEEARLRAERTRLRRAFRRFGQG